MSLGSGRGRLAQPLGKRGPGLEAGSGPRCRRALGPASLCLSVPSVKRGDRGPPPHRASVKMTHELVRGRENHSSVLTSGPLPGPVRRAG